MGADSIEKTTVTATAIPSPREEADDILAEESGTVKPNHNITAAVWTIVWGVALPCIPVIVVSAVLLYFIFHYRIVERPGWPDLHLQAEHIHQHRNSTQLLQYVRHQGGQWAYYVHYNPSTITTIASWTGRVIPYLSSSIMALVAFFAARRIVTKSKRNDGSDLPSPEQLSLLIGLLGGNSFQPLKDTLLHRWAKKNRLVDPIPLAFYALLIVTSIAVLIPLVDTWFGIATTPAIITQLYNHTGKYQTFGRYLDGTYCNDGPGGFGAFGGLEWVSCNFLYDDNNPYGIDATLVNPEEATRLDQGVSYQNTILNYTGADGTTYFYLASQGLDGKLDFMAKTFAVTTQCAPRTQECLSDSVWPDANFPDESFGKYNFTCSPGFQANFTFDGAVQTIDASGADGGADRSSATTPPSPMIGMAFSTDADLTHRVGAYNESLTEVFYEVAGYGKLKPDSPLIGSNLSYQYLLPQNPLHFAVWALGFPAFNVKEVTNGVITNPLLNDTQIFRDMTSYWVLGCEAVVHDVQYTWVNGSIHTFNATPSSPEMAGMISAPFAFQLGPATVSLTSIASLAGTKNTSEDLANTFADGWSKSALAMSVGVLDAAPTIIEQVRNSTIHVARVPMVPLYLLLGLKGLYVLAVILLAIGAYCFTHPAETEIVKAQLSAKGLAAAHFDSPDLLQQNVVKELGARLQKHKTGEAAPQDAPGEPGVKRAQTLPNELGQIGEKKVGLVPNAQGVWRFAVVADGVWNSIKPIAVNMVDMEASAGNLGLAGEVLNAWK